MSVVCVVFMATRLSPRLLTGQKGVGFREPDLLNFSVAFRVEEFAGLQRKSVVLIA